MNKFGIQGGMCRVAPASSPVWQGDGHKVIIRFLAGSCIIPLQEHTEEPPSTCQKTYGTRHGIRHKPVTNLLVGIFVGELEFPCAPQRQPHNRFPRLVVLVRGNDSLQQRQP
jgi:hypothetical protein